MICVNYEMINGYWLYVCFFKPVYLHLYIIEMQWCGCLLYRLRLLCVIKGINKGKSRMCCNFLEHCSFPNVYLFYLLDIWTSAIYWFLLCQLRLFISIKGNTHIWHGWFLSSLFHQGTLLPVTKRIILLLVTKPLNFLVILRTMSYVWHVSCKHCLACHTSSISRVSCTSDVYCVTRSVKSDIQGSTMK